jgi:hypothetical protein
MSAESTDWIPPILSQEEWQDPLPLESELPPVESISEDLLPVSVRPLVRDVAERMQTPADYPAVAAVLSLSGAVNRRAIIQPKSNDTSWQVVPNLWGGLIGPPGFMKSGVIRAVTRPLERIQELWRHQFQGELDEYLREKEEADLRYSAWRDQYKAASKKPAVTLPIRPDNTIRVPTLRRLVVNDATFEKLHEIMAQNPAGVLVINDELPGWWSTLDKPGREGERAFCLQAWNGDTGHTIDRIQRGTIHVEACCMSMLGGIQPGRLRSYLVDALEDGPSNDGLIQRFQLLVWPDTPAGWRYVDRKPDAACEEIVSQVFSRLVELDSEYPLRFQFHPDAQQLFVEWLADLESKVRAGDLHAALVSHLSKYRSLMPSLAVLFELADRAATGFDVFVGANPRESPNFWVSLEHAKQAAAWCDYLESHARRIYSCVTTRRMRAARELADKIKQRKIGANGFFTCRDVYVKGWSGLDSPEAVKLAVEVLQDACWVRGVVSEPSPFGGRPSNRYAVNPRVPR